MANVNAMVDAKIASMLAELNQEKTQGKDPEEPITVQHFFTAGSLVNLSLTLSHSPLSPTVQSAQALQTLRANGKKPNSERLK